MFTYGDLLNEMQLFCAHGIETGGIGNSTLGQRIPYVFVGNKNGNYLIVQGGIHAREHITSLLVVYLAKHLVKNPDLKMLGGIYFIPMTNPDGVRLCQEGVGFLKNKERKSNLIAVNNGKTDFSLWKANVNGVDLNVNFDADWGKGEKNEYVKGSENYVGVAPFSEAETHALRRFTETVKPLVTLSYHCKGEQIYWYFNQQPREKYRDKRYAEALKTLTGYTLCDRNGSAGGYKDWCIDKLKIPSFTLEVGNDKFSHPFPYDEFENILSQNEDLPRKLLNSVVYDAQRLKETEY